MARKLAGPDATHTETPSIDFLCHLEGTGGRMGGMELRITGDPVADKLLSDDAFALLVGIDCVNVIGAH